MLKFKAAAVLSLMLLATLAVPGTAVAAAAPQTTVAVIIDYGNGQVCSADVSLTTGMTAFDATLQAASQMGIAVNATHYSFGWSINSINFIGDNVTGYNFTSGEYWGFWLWNSTSGEWESSMLGSSSVAANSTAAIGWVFAPFGVAPLPTPEHRNPWRSFRADNYNSGTQNASAPNNITLKWAKDLNNGSIDAPVVAANGFAYVVASGKQNLNTFMFEGDSMLFCLDSNGNVVWSKSIGVGWYQDGAALIYNGKVFVASADGKVYAFNAKNGTSVWAQPFDMKSGLVFGNPSPIAYGGLIYVASGNGKLFALSEEGTQVWNVTVASSIYTSSPAAKNGVIYIGAEDGKLHSYYSTNGAQKWNVTVGGKVRGMPLLTGNDIAVTYINGTGASATGGIAVVGYDGTIKSYVSTGVTPGSAAQAGQGAFVSATATNAFMTSADGRVLLNVTLGTQNGFAPGAPSTVQGLAFMVTNENRSRLVAINDKGEIAFQTPLDPEQYALASPTIADGVLYAAVDNGRVYAFTLSKESAPASFIATTHNLALTFTTPSIGSLVYCTWSFGDGAHAVGKTATHTYAAAGDYTVNLTLSFPVGVNQTVSRTVTVHDFTAPRNLVAVAGEGKVTLNWTAPSDDGGMSIVSYKVYRAVQGGEASLLATVLAPNLTYVDTTGVIGTAYTYYVVAVNGQGAGPASAAQTATSQAVPADNTVLYVAIVIVILAIVAAAAVFIMRGRKK